MSVGMEVAHNIKVGIVGDGCVGKTSVLIRWTCGSFPPKYEYITPMSANVMFEGKPCILRLWDFLCGEEFDRESAWNYPQTDIFLLCFSVINAASFENVRCKWYPVVSHYCPDAPFIIVGTKRDLRADPVANEPYIRRGMPPVSFQMASEMVLELHASAYVETSSLTGEHIQDLFTCALRIATRTPRKPPKRNKSVPSLSWGTIWNAVVPRTGTPKPSTAAHRPSWLPLFTNVDVAARYGHTQSRCGSVLFTVGGMCAEGAPPAPEVLRFEYSSGSWLQPIPLEITAGNDNQRNSVVYKGMTFAASAFVDNLMFLFGGKSNSYTNSLHCLNLTTGEWSLLPEGNRAESPSPRYGSSMISFAKCLFVFGGCDCNGAACEDTKCYDLVSQGWIPVPVKPGKKIPSGRFHHTSVCHNRNMIIFGKTPKYGHTQSRCGSVLFTVGGMCAEGAPPAPEVLRFEYSSGSWLQPIPLGITACNNNQRNSVVYKGMTFAASAFVDNLMFLFGGKSNSYTNSLHCLNLTTGEWSLLPEGNRAESPSPRYGSSMVAFAMCLFVFGGRDCNGAACEDTKCYDLVSQGWIPVPVKPGKKIPSGRFHHTSVCHNRNMIIFGGILKGKKLNDLWILDISTKVWLHPVTQGITPPPMRGHSAAVIGDEMFVCSCDLPANPSSMALFKLTLGSTTTLEWTRVEIGNTPPVREFHTLLSSETGSLILAGGRALTPSSGTPSGKMHGDAWWLQLFSNVFGMLPHELWMNIFSFCDPKDLFRISAVCWDFRTLASSDVLWTRFIPPSIINRSSNQGAPLKSLFVSSAAVYIYTSGATLTDSWIFVP
ncbi:small GTPase Rac protein 1 [Pelomyxa schiedti]|nr:small GTPase Rac protein 1 [Pelomyxa schiedti]